MSPRLLTHQVVLDVAIYLIVAIPVVVLFMMGTPYQVGFFCDDRSLMYPYKKDSVSGIVAAATAFGTVVVLILFVELLNCAGQRIVCKYNAVAFHCIKTYGVFAFGFGINQLFVEVIKNQSGTLRPNFFSVCQPAYNKTKCNMEFITDYVCTSTEYSSREVRSSRESFPSGHTAIAVFSAVFLIWYMEKRLKMNYSYFLKPTLQLGLVLGAVVCAISRLRDHKHHVQDIVGGSICGATNASALMYTIGRRALFTKPELKHNQIERKCLNGCANEHPTAVTLVETDQCNGVNGHCISTEAI